MVARVFSQPTQPWVFKSVFVAVNAGSRFAPPRRYSNSTALTAGLCLVSVNSKTLQPYRITPKDRIGISFISISYDEMKKRNPDLKFNKNGSLNSKIK